MAVGIVLTTYSPEQRTKLRVLDPACGTGGFLRATLIEMRKIVEDRVKRKYGNRLVVCQRRIYGFEGKWRGNLL